MGCAVRFLCAETYHFRERHLMTPARMLLSGALGMAVLGLFAWFVLRKPNGEPNASLAAPASVAQPEVAGAARLANVNQSTATRTPPESPGNANAVNKTAEQVGTEARPQTDRSRIPGTREWRARILRNDLAAFEAAAARMDAEQWENFLMPVLTSAVAVELDRAGRHLPLSESSQPLPSQHEFQFNNGKYRPGAGEFPVYDEFMAARAAQSRARRAFEDSKAPGRYQNSYPFDPGYVQRVRDLVAQAEAHLQESDAPWPESQYAR